MGTMIGCGDAADWGKGGAESKRVRALCFWGRESQDKGETNGLERVRFVRFWAEKNAPLPE